MDLQALVEFDPEPLHFPEPIDAKRPCPKCQSRWTRTSHCTGLTTGACFDAWFRFPVLLADHFHRWCDGCGYGWFERPAAIERDHVLPRCEQCYGQEDPDDPEVGFVLPCPDCDTLLCQPCADDGCVSCSQITDAEEVLRVAGLLQASIPITEQPWVARLPSVGTPGDPGWDGPVGEGVQVRGIFDPLTVEGYGEAGGGADENPPGLGDARPGDGVDDSVLPAEAEVEQGAVADPAV